ncbi:hypothetical protein PHYBOEH_006415 [Phytophthora boehmeriae]|uniref:Uncharacterized protein n=1 Tax=Phytophthora boehmeriae TaxID=109152 RepID=A0A8T1X7G2_9STRA|nr:hypothetical protein PHYBOEH_006415 [Phytophthora boehmeriae]
MSDNDVKTLVELSVAAVAASTPVSELLAYIEYLPVAIRHQIFHELSNFRLREMEVAWQRAAETQESLEPSDGFDPDAGDRFLFDRETQQVWERRMNASRFGYEPNSIQDAQGRRRNHRHMFWEHQFRTLLKLRTPLQSPRPIDVLTDYGDLFVDVVEVLKVHGREVCGDNVELLLRLRRLRRLEVHHPEQQSTCWESMKMLMQHPHLSEVGYFHGKLSNEQLALIRRTLAQPEPTLDKYLVDAELKNCSRITTLELVSVKIRPEGYRQLVAVVGEMKELVQLRLSNTITDFDTKLLVDAALRGPKLQRLFLEHNELEDDAFAGLVKMQTPLAVRHLRLTDNAVSPITLGAICRASMDGVLNLERLELTSNVDIGDPGIHALTPMLASPSVDTVAGLTHLDVRGCSFGIEAATNLLLALGDNKRLAHLNIAQNFLDVGFGDVLADFLSKNEAVTSLQANDVGLGLVGVSPRLLIALQSNITLTSLSFGANRLRDYGAAALLRAIVKRAQIKPFRLVDLSGNLLTQSGLGMIADALKPSADNTTHRRKTMLENGSYDEMAQHHRKRQRTSSTQSHQNSLSPRQPTDKAIQELCLLNNDFVGESECSDDTPTLIESIREHVGHLISNEWTMQRQVYDDEV